MHHHSFNQKLVWIDATGILSWGLQPLTGIQRVEMNLCDFAMKNEHVGLVVMDQFGQFRVASKRVKDYLSFISENLEYRRSTSTRKQIKNTFAFFDLQLQFGRNRTARRIADLIEQRSFIERVLYNII